MPIGRQTVHTLFLNRGRNCSSSLRNGIRCRVSRRTLYYMTGITMPFVLAESLMGYETSAEMMVMEFRRAQAGLVAPRQGALGLGGDHFIGGPTPFLRLGGLRGEREGHPGSCRRPSSPGKLPSRLRPTPGEVAIRSFALVLALREAPGFRA